MKRTNNSYWNDSTEFQSFPSLSEDKNVDVTIVGGGLTGITSAYLLANEGLKVAIIEADRILHGTTGHTTAKVTVQHGLIYDELFQHIGKEKAKLYYQANNEALQFIHKTVNDNKINCCLVNEDAIIYTNSDQYISKLEKEFRAYNKLGIKSEFMDSIPFDIQVKAAINISKQSQFHPLKYLYHLAKVFINNGGTIFENTVAVNIEEGHQPKVITRDGHKITSNYVIIASHFPFYEFKGLYFSRMYAKRSYVIGIRAENEYHGGMYINAENPTRSLRYTEYNDEKMILVGGDSHKTGQGKSESTHYQALQNFAQEVLGVNEIKYRWSTQDLITLDKIPYIGHLTSTRHNILVATGYRKWGMTNGTAASLLMKDMILDKENSYQELFTPSRFYIDPSLKKFISMNADVAKHLIKGKLEIIDKTIEELDNDEGKVVTINGKRAGAYKDENGEVHIVDTTCTHLGCELEWNDAERTWDCPCHGSRFAYTGEIVEGPAEKSLEILSD